MKRRHDIPHSKERIRRKRKHAIASAILVSVALMMIVFGAAWIAYRPAIRIANVEVSGNRVMDSDTIASFVREQLQGTYLFLFPKDNTFLYPKHGITQDLLVSFARIRSADVARDGLTALAVNIRERAPFALWCGAIFENQNDDRETCYFTDSDGFIFAEAPHFSDNVYLKFYAPLETPETETTAENRSPIASRFLSPDQFRNINLFHDLLLRDGITISKAVAMPDGDWSFMMDEEGKILFNVAEDPMRLAADFESAFRAELGEPNDPKLRNNIDYVDLRFGGKVFFKKKTS